METQAGSGPEPVPAAGGGWLEGDGDADEGAGGGGVDGELGGEAGGALAHADEAEVDGGAVAGGVRGGGVVGIEAVVGIGVGVEAVAVVAHGEDGGVGGLGGGLGDGLGGGLGCGLFEGDPEVGGVGVLQAVGDGLLADAEEMLGGVLREGAWEWRQVEVDAGARAGDEAGDGGAQELLEVDGLGEGAQGGDGLVGLGAAVAHHAEGGFEVQLGGGAIAVEVSLDDFELEGDAGESLGEGVVDVARDACALGENGGELAADAAERGLSGRWWRGGRGRR